MCTVTRPGLAPIAAATAVELLASLLQHPDGFVCLFFSPRQSEFSSFTLYRLFSPAPPPNTNNSSSSEPDEGLNSVLGVVPHQLRGFLGQFRTMPLVGAAYDKCTGCSETVRFSFSVYWFVYLIGWILKGSESVRNTRVLHAFGSLQRRKISRNANRLG